MAEAPPNGPTNPFPPDPLRTALTCAVAGVTAFAMSGSILAGATVSGTSIVANWIGWRMERSTTRS